MLLYVHRDHKDYYGFGMGGGGEGERARMAILTFTQLPSLFVQYCFISTKTIRTIRDRGVQDGHLDFHTVPDLFCEFKFNVALCPQRP